MVASSERVNGPATCLNQKPPGGRDPVLCCWAKAQGPLKTTTLRTWMAQTNPLISELHRASLLKNCQRPFRFYSVKYVSPLSTRNVVFTENNHVCIQRSFKKIQLCIYKSQSFLPFEKKNYLAFNN